MSSDTAGVSKPVSSQPSPSKEGRGLANGETKSSASPEHSRNESPASPKTAATEGADAPTASSRIASVPSTPSKGEAKKPPSPPPAKSERSITPDSSSRSQTPTPGPTKLTSAEKKRRKREKEKKMKAIADAEAEGPLHKPSEKKDDRPSSSPPSHHAGHHHQHQHHQAAMMNSPLVDGSFHAHHPQFNHATQTTEDSALPSFRDYDAHAGFHNSFVDQLHDSFQQQMSSSFAGASLHPHYSTIPVNDDPSELPVIPALVGESVMKYCERQVFPTMAALQRRKRVAAIAEDALFRALNQCGVMLDVRSLVFGSVDLRTFLPDGDIDMTLFVPRDPPPPPAADGDPPGSPVPSSRTTTWLGRNTDSLQRVRDILPQFNVAVDSLVLAEVSVLKCVIDGTSLDITMDQVGGVATATFLHDVDITFGHEHLFKKTLILVKAWGFYEARILGAQGGFLGTYALSVMLIAVMNQVSTERSVWESAAVTPLYILMRFLHYYSIFDFQSNCVSVTGKVRLEGPVLGDLPECSNSSNFALPLNAVLRHCTECARFSGIDRRTPSMTPPPSPQTGGDEPAADSAQFGRKCKRGRSHSAAALPRQRIDVPTRSPSQPSRAPPPWRTAPLPMVQEVDYIRQMGFFPVRAMNVLDPLRPSSNLCRGIPKYNANRLQRAFRRGFRDFVDALQEDVNSGHDGLNVLDKFFTCTCRATSHYPSELPMDLQYGQAFQGGSPSLCIGFDLQAKPGTVAEPAKLECGCSEPSIFCTPVEQRKKALATSIHVGEVVMPTPLHNMGMHFGAQRQSVPYSMPTHLHHHGGGHHHHHQRMSSPQGATGPNTQPHPIAAQYPSYQPTSRTQHHRPGPPNVRSPPPNIRNKSPVPGYSQAPPPQPGNQASGTPFGVLYQTQFPPIFNGMSRYGPPATVMGKQAIQSGGQAPPPPPPPQQQQPQQPQQQSQQQPSQSQQPQALQQGNGRQPAPRPKKDRERRLDYTPVVQSDTSPTVQTSSKADFPPLPGQELMAQPPQMIPQQQAYIQPTQPLPQPQQPLKAVPNLSHTSAVEAAKPPTGQQMVPPGTGTRWVPQSMYGASSSPATPPITPSPGSAPIVMVMQGSAPTLPAPAYPAPSYTSPLQMHPAGFHRFPNTPTIAQHTSNADGDRYVPPRSKGVVDFGTTPPAQDTPVLGTTPSDGSAAALSEVTTEAAPPVPEADATAGPQKKKYTPPNRKPLMMMNTTLTTLTASLPSSQSRGINRTDGPATGTATPGGAAPGPAAAKPADADAANVRAEVPVRSDAPSSSETGSKDAAKDRGRRPPGDAKDKAREPKAGTTGGRPRGTKGDAKR